MDSKGKAPIFQPKTKNQPPKKKGFLGERTSRQNKLGKNLSPQRKKQDTLSGDFRRGKKGVLKERKEDVESICNKGSKGVVSSVI